MGKKLSSGEIISKIITRIKSILIEFWVMVLHFVGHIPIHHVRRLFYRLSGMKIGRGSTIHTGARFYYPGNIKIGEDTVIGENCVLDGREKLIIGNHVDIASEVMIYNAQHDVQSEDFKPIFKEVVIENHVFIGPRAIILPGVKIQKGAIVAAGAVVTNDIDSMKIVGGVPAKEIGERKVRDLHYKLGRANWFR